MPRIDIDRIRRKFRALEYDLTAHATEEMAEDLLVIGDVECATHGGRVTRVERDDPRGTRYVVEGVATDGMTRVRVVGRFTTTGRYLVITVYAITDKES